MRKCFTLMAALLMGLVSYGQINLQVAPMNAPNYINANDMVKIGSDVYIASEGGLYVSSNAGATWSRITSLNEATGVTYVNKIYSSGNFLFAESNGRLFRSSDNGVSWTDKTPQFLMSGILSSGQVGSNIVVIASDTAFMSNNKRLFLSNNGGDSWASGAIFSQNWDYGFVNGQVYVSTSDTFQLSANALTFNNIALTGLPTGSAGVSISDVVGDGTNIYCSAEATLGSRAFRTPSTNPGNWTSINTGLPFISLGIFIQPMGSSLLAVSIGANFSLSMFRSTNSGTNWSSYTPIGLNNNVITNGIELNPGEFLAVSVYEIKKSVDNGVTWSSSANSTPSYSSIKSEKPIEFNGGLSIDQLFGTLRSTDGGLTWANASSGIPATFAFDFSPFGSRTFFRSGGKIHYFSAGFTSNTLYSSTNGTNWTAGSTRPGNNSTFYVRAASNDYMITEGNDTTFFSSTNGGTNWTDITSSTKPLIGSNGYFYRSDDNGAGIALIVPGMMGQQVSFTNNGGATWTSTNTAATALYDFTKMAIVGNSMFVLSSNFTGQEVWHWSVASQNWTQITGAPAGLPPFPSFIEFQGAVVNNSLVLAAITDSALFYSADSGRTFTKVITGIPTWVRHAKLTLYSNGNIYINTENWGLIKGTVTTGLSGERVKISFNIFPNPSNGSLNIRVSNNASISITDLQGRTLVQNLSADTENGLTLNVSNWVPGIYLCHVKSGNTITTQKLIVSQ